MKRTPLKRYTPLRAKKALKRGTVLKKSKVAPRSKLTPLPRLKKQLWELCRQITMKRYPNVCFTCGKPVEGSNRQLGHFIPSSTGGILLRYNLDNLRWQCYYDNINLGGNGSEFYPRLVNEIGQERVDNLFTLKRKTARADRYFYETTISEYKSLLETL